VPTTAADVIELFDVADQLEGEPVLVGGWGVGAHAGDGRALEVVTGHFRIWIRAEAVLVRCRP
jgi:hypothetical protein